MKYFFLKFIVFWSIKITEFVEKFNKTAINALFAHYDMLVKFVNEYYFEGAGKLDHVLFGIYEFFIVGFQGVYQV